MPTPLKLIEAGQYRLQPTEFALSEYTWRFLAEGDSWFSIGALNPLRSANLLQSMAFSRMAVAFHCSYPGDTLRHVVDMRKDPNFEQLLEGNMSGRWDAILLSAGGNDLIDALQVPPDSASEHRLLRTAPEWGLESDGPQRYLNEGGWRTFDRYFQDNLELLIRLRDSKRGERGSFGRPLCMHTYAYPTPRDSGPGLGLHAWLLPAMLRYAIPVEDWVALARVLLDRLAELMLACARDGTRFPALHVFDSRAVDIVPAAPGSRGVSGDWVNEIHLSSEGCAKLARPWCEQIERVIAANP